MKDIILLMYNLVRSFLDTMPHEHCTIIKQNNWIMLVSIIFFIILNESVLMLCCLFTTVVNILDAWYLDAWNIILKIFEIIIKIIKNIVHIKRFKKYICISKVKENMYWKHLIFSSCNSNSKIFFATFKLPYRWINKT